MSLHKMSLKWKRTSPDFSYENYNREHSWYFKDGQMVQASAAPEYLGKNSCVDPEEAFVASVSSCHMLTFLAIASKKRLIVDEYTDDAFGTLEKGEDGKLRMTQIVLKPKVTFKEHVSKDVLDALHVKAHEHCFIANSISTKVTVE